MTSVITLQGKEFKAKLDFATLGRTQAALKKEYGITIKFQEIFTEVQNQNFAVITELLVQSILRCHKQFTREQIEEKLTLDNIEPIFKFISDLIIDSLPADDKKK